MNVAASVSSVAASSRGAQAAPARFFCTCGGYVEAFLPGSVNRERVVLSRREMGAV